MKISDEDYNSILDVAYDELSNSDGMDRDEWIDNLKLATHGRLNDLTEDIASEYEITEKLAAKIIKQAAKQILKEDEESAEEDEFDYVQDDWF